jgi:putative transposase
MKYRFISAHRETFKVGRMCALLKVSRSGFYAWLTRPESQRSRENRSLETKIRVFHAASHGIYGSPKVHQDLIDDGVRCGKNRVARIMREAGIRSRRRKKFKATTNSRHNLPVAANLLDQDFTAEEGVKSALDSCCIKGAPKIGGKSAAYDSDCDFGRAFHPPQLQF